MDSFNPFARTCREVTPDDLASATRALGLRRMPEDGLMSLVAIHHSIDAFASKVPPTANPTVSVLSP